MGTAAMDPQTVAYLLTVKFPSLAEMEASRRAANESCDSDVSPEEKRHISDQKRRMRNIQPDGHKTVHGCQICEINFDLPSRLIAHHIYKHEGVPRRPKVECPTCHRMCKTRAIMVLHLGTHKGERLCFKCGAEFASARSALAHKHMHRNGGRFQCGICNELFVCKSDRDEHRLQHTRRRQPIPPVCPSIDYRRHTINDGKLDTAAEAAAETAGASARD